MLGNRADAEEALQDVFLRVLSTSSRYEGKGELGAWLCRITRNHCLNRIRDQKRRSQLLSEHVAPGVQTWTTQPPIERVTVRKLLARADERQAAAALYVYCDGLSHDEAALQLGVARTTVGNLLRRFEEFCTSQLQTAEPPPAAAPGIAALHGG